MRLTDRVRRALGSADVCHREPEFRDLVAKVRAQLRNVYGEQDYTAVLIGGSGTAAVETMLSLVGRHDTALVVANGVYGERMAAMLEAQGKAHEVVRSEWTSGIDLEAANAALATGRFQFVLAVHHETTTGRLNDVGALGALAREHGVRMLLDAVSSFAGEELRLAEWNIEALAATANKCVHGAPGVSFVLAQSAALARVPANGGATSVYLDLARHANDQARGSTPFTLPTHVMRAFDEALTELEDEGGWRTRHATYAERSKQVRAVCAELGASLLLGDDAAYGATLTSFRLPGGVTYEALHAQLKQDGFVIYAGQGKFEGAIFRIAVMGALCGDDLEDLARSLRRILR
ncbi:MAG TPA: aminotransferase class V-fold PLP-dependent enzyme [Novosphingobium sp.]